MTLQIPDLPTIESELKADFVKIFGNDINFDPSTPTGQLVALLSAQIFQLYEFVQACYTSSRLDQAAGDYLDRIATLINAFRKQGEKTICKACHLTGTNGTVIPAGSSAKTASGVIFYSASDVTIADSVADVDFISADFGAFTVSAGQLTTIVDSITGWASITNPTPAVEGSIKETDGEFRSRLLNMSTNRSSNLMGSIKSNVLAIEGVSDVFVYVNYSDAAAPAPYASPAHSVWVVVNYLDRTLDKKIGEAIFSVIPPVETYNAASHGAQAQVWAGDFSTISDPNLYVKWNIAEAFPVNFKIEMLQETDFSNADEQEITQALTDFINNNLSISETLYYSKIFAAIVDSVPGATIEKFYMSDVTNPPTVGDDVDLTPAFYQIVTLGEVTFSYVS